MKEPMTKQSKLSPAQQYALHASAHGGHGYGEYSGIRSSTARALAGKGLVVLGTIKRSDGRSFHWFIHAGARTPLGFISYADQQKAWDELQARVDAHDAQRRADFVAAFQAAKGRDPDAAILDEAIADHGIKVLDALTRTLGI
jgi:hypothetical protein